MDDGELLAAFEAVEHEALHFEWVDFLADFGNNEDFLIDGDSLVAWVLNSTENEIDWSHGGQLLHAGTTAVAARHGCATPLISACRSTFGRAISREAHAPRLQVYSVFLRRLPRPMEGAATTFLAVSTDMCMRIAPRKGVRSTDSSLQAVGSNKLLAREAIIRHLQLMNYKHKRCHGPNADVVRLHVLRGNIFQRSGLGESLRVQLSAEWSDLLRNTRPAFVMTNPGWFHVGPPIVKLLTHAMMHQLHQVRSSGLRLVRAPVEPRILCTRAPPLPYRGAAC